MDFDIGRRAWGRGVHREYTAIQEFMEGGVNGKGEFIFYKRKKGWNRTTVTVLCYHK